MSSQRYLRIAEVIAEAGLQGLVISDPDNIVYASGGMVLPFPHQYPERLFVMVLNSDGKAGIICPVDSFEAIRDQGWMGDLLPYDENEKVSYLVVVEKIADLLKDYGLGKGKVGIDKRGCPAVLDKYLKENLQDVMWASSDNLLKKTRLVKTEEEIELLEEAAVQSDKGVIGALNHLEGGVDVPGYTLAEVAERSRVHVIEHGGTGIGHIAAMQGPESRFYFSLPKDKVKNGSLLRIDTNNHYKGYWSCSGRMTVIGEPSPEQIVSFENNLALKKVAIAQLKAGVKCSQVFEAVEKYAAENQIEFWKDVGLGHGVGVSEIEGPYLTVDDETILETGMVLALDILTYGPRRELIHSIDIFAVEDNGSRLLSWYKRWDRLYVVTGIRQSH